VVVLRCALLPLVDVLLRILSGEVDVVVRLPQMVRACLAGMSVWDVKTTQTTRVPIHKLLCEVQVRGGLDMLRLWWCCKISSANGWRSHVPRCSSRRDQHDGGSTPSCIESRRRATAASATASSSLPAAASEYVGGKLTAACQSVGGKWGWRLRLASLASDAASSIALVE